MFKIQSVFCHHFGLLKTKNVTCTLDWLNETSFLPHGKHQEEDASPRGATQRALRTFSIMAQREAEESNSQGFFSGKIFGEHVKVRHGPYL